MAFIQEPPDLENQFDHDPILSSYINQILPVSHRKRVVGDLQRLGQRTIEDILRAGEDAEAHEPRLLQYDVWGNRVDQVITAQGWSQLKTIAAEEGLVAIGYEREFGEYSRIVQFAKLLLYTPSSAIFTCPLAMTDGAARLIETHCPDLLNEQFYHLTSRNPVFFWTSGQWMTEKAGGSDLSGSATIARWDGEQYRLHGDKWFTSAITGEMTMTLARIEEAGQLDERLSLFFLQIRDDEGRLNAMRINKLKDKLGTRALPTAELTLDGSAAILIGDRGRGVKQIATILNITRIYNSIAALSYMHRGLYLAKAYAKKRRAFGSTLDQLPLHRQVLAQLEVDYLQAFVAVAYTVELMGKVELQVASAEEELMFRLLTPLVKLYTGKVSVRFLSEVLESYGGLGYMEELPLAKLLRDAQVYPIWEGTTNVLSLDMLRVLSKHGLDYFFELVELEGGELDSSPVSQALDQLGSYVKAFAAADIAVQQLAARKLAFSLTRVVIASRLFAGHQQMPELQPKLAIAYRRLVGQGLVDLVPLDGDDVEEQRVLLDEEEG